MREATVTVVLLLAAACSSTTTTSTHTGPCVGRTGSYRAHVAVTAGGSKACGVVADQIIVLDSNGQSASTAGCSGSSQVSADQCTVTIDEACPEPGACVGCSSVTSGTVTWSQDGRSGSGSLEIRGLNADKTIGCDGIYDVTYAKQ
jgi:hypothetical protein